jgi:hypothetical protein
MMGGKKKEKKRKSVAATFDMLKFDVIRLTVKIIGGC